VQPVTKVSWQAVVTLNETDRNTGGFGSTGTS
jgi:dUTPase